MLSWEYPPSSAGGTAAHVDGLARAMVRTGHDVAIVTRYVPTAARNTIVDGVHIIRTDIDMPWLPDNPLAQTASGNHAFVAATRFAR